ncbi:MAG TPA: TlpA disulfide reductase family protein [Segetibacter sp.]|jgi:peroxiredoxin
MKNITLLVALILLLIAYNKVVGQTSFSVALLPSPEILKDYNLYYLEISNAGNYKRDTGVRVDTRITLQGDVSEPTLSKLTFASTGSPETKKAHSINVIAEPGASIVVDLTKGFDKPLYSGSPTQSEYTRYVSAIVPLQNSISKQLQSYMSEKDSLKQNALGVKMKSLSDSARKESIAFFRKNPSSYVTALLFKNLVNMVWDNATEAYEIYQLLPQSSKDISTVQAFYKQLQLAVDLSIGKRFPDFELPDMTGTKVKVSSYKGKYLFVDFWASWCAPCRAEAPHLIESYNRYKEKGYDILGISFDEAISPWVSAVKKDKYTWTNVLDITGMGENSFLSNRMGIKAIPRNFLIDPDGIIIATNLRGKELLKKLQTIL